MKTFLLVFFSVLTVFRGLSQDDTPPYKKNPAIPSFEIQKTDKSIFTNAKLKKNIPVIIIFFSPTCEHCLHQMDAMMKRVNDLKKYQIVMATYQPDEELVEFDKKYQLKKHPNFTTGRDIRYFFPPFYAIRNFPYLAFYDKQGKLKSTNEGTMSVDDMIKRLK
jgi:cytochrome oxidase Cu insertion factor (SCO1/SenC/PrrC family)